MKKNILVVDKDQFLLYGLVKALKDDGCEVKTAETASEAVEKLSYCPYDVCLLDGRLTDLDGFGLIKVINDICPETKVILMAADPVDSQELSENDSAAVDLGASYCIPKPFALNEVTDVVRQILSGREAENTPAKFFRTDPEARSRKHVRKTCNEVICFGMSVIHEGINTRLTLKGTAVDISDGGIGLLTSYPLRESQVVGFNGKMDERFGVVAWSRMVDKESFRVGIRFA